MAEPFPRGEHPLTAHRPRSPAGHRGHVIPVRLSAAELARLRAAAQRDGLSLAAELRRPFADTAGSVSEEGEPDA